MCCYSTCSLSWRFMSSRASWTYSEVVLRLAWPSTSCTTRSWVPRLTVWVSKVGGVRWSWRRVLSQEIVEYFYRLAPVQRLPRPAVQLRSHAVKLGLRVHRQVGALREVLSEQPVRVLVRTTLPWRVGIAEIYGNPRADGEFGVTGHLLALVPGYAVAEELRQHAHLRRQKIRHPFG